MKKTKVDKQSHIWNKFVQMISTLEEYSKIACKNCLKTLNHSTTIDESSTINIIKHLKIVACKKRKRFNSFSQLELAFNRINSI